MTSPDSPGAPSPDATAHGAHAAHTVEMAAGSSQPAAGDTRPSRAAPLDNFLGRVVGKYLVKGLLGQGGMGVVFLAHDLTLERDVALKMLPEELAKDERTLQRFLAEARVAARLSHHHTVAVYEVGHEGELYYIAQELVTGGSLADALDTHGPYAPAEATRLVADACKGLAAAHAVGLVHRDVKPANLMRAADGTVKVADFGLAKVADARTRQMTQTGLVVGTPYYMSPEQCQAQPVDARSDLYSLGAAYYTLLTGLNPYHETGSALQVMFAHCNADVPDPCKVRPGVPAACAAVVARAMAKKPADRYQAADEMLADLNAVLAGLSTGTTPALSNRALPQAAGTAAAASGPPPRRYGRVLVTLGLAALLLWGAVTIGGHYLYSQPGPADPSSARGVPAPAGEPVRVGVLHSMSGTMSVSETPVVDAVLLAVEELNKEGGVLGRPVEAVIADGESSAEVFAREARRLIADEKVCTVFGCWTSADRKAVVPVVQELDHLLVYPLQYEGIEMSPNVMYLGAAPNQQIIPAVRWAVETLGRRKVFLVGSDYVFPRVANAIVKDQLKQLGAELAGEAYVPLGSPELKEVVERLRAARPELILNTINGDSNVAFFRDLRAAGVTPADTPTLSFSIGEQEVRGLGVARAAGDYCAWTYFQTLDSWVGHRRGGPLPDPFSNGPPPNRTCTFRRIRLSGVLEVLSVQLPGVQRRVASLTEDQCLPLPDDHQPLPPCDLLLL